MQALQAVMLNCLKTQVVFNSNFVYEVSELYTEALNHRQNVK